MSLTTISSDNVFKKGVIGNVRKAQEDCHDIAPMTPNGDLFVVCDGMGGHVGGAKASSLAVESIIEYIKKEKYPDPIQALDGALQYANMQILGFASEHPDYRGMGTTACILLIQGNDAWIAHVGDSRIYLYLGKEKQLHRITKDHSFVQTLVDMGQITDDEAEHHPQKNRILKALGIKPELQPTFSHVPIHPKNGDVFLICSDGLSGMIPDSTISRVLGSKDTIEQKGERLIELAMQGETVVPGGQDNCTLELIHIDSSPWKKSEFQSFNPVGAPQPEPTKPSFWRTPWPYIIGLVAILFVVLAVFILLRNKPSNEGDGKIEKLQAELKAAQKECTKDSIEYAKAKSKNQKIADDIVIYTDSLATAKGNDKKRIDETIKSANENMDKMKPTLEKLEQKFKVSQKKRDDVLKALNDAKKADSNSESTPKENPPSATPKKDNKENTTDIKNDNSNSDAETVTINTLDLKNDHRQLYVKITIKNDTVVKVEPIYNSEKEITDATKAAVNKLIDKGEFNRWKNLSVDKALKEHLQVGKDGKDKDSIERLDGQITYGLNYYKKNHKKSTR
ncbi:MAG: Stp1/IreP family PP2C-type Ser/Thr phosphatase [Bacteroidales bacterium]|nr:Stp1/IreP family PP2C-type Ser/Thr phosphatase [Bacteroidales bacterium]